jgi:transposase
MGAKPLTQEKKELILHARKMGKSVKEICVLYLVGKTAVYDLYTLYDKTGKTETGKERKGRPGRIDKETLECIRLRIIEKNDLTLQELIEEFDLRLSVPALSVAIRSKLNFNLKKDILCQRTATN